LTIAFKTRWWPSSYMN